jgi:hypothetical protein
MLQVKEHAPTPYLSIVFTFRLAVESTKEFGGVSHTFFTITNPKAREHIHKIENVCFSTKPFPNLNDMRQHQDLCNLLVVVK